MGPSSDSTEVTRRSMSAADVTSAANVLARRPVAEAIFAAASSPDHSRVLSARHPRQLPPAPWPS